MHIEAIAVIGPADSSIGSIFELSLHFTVILELIVNFLNIFSKLRSKIVSQTLHLRSIFKQDSQAPF